MSIAEKLKTIAENQQMVHDSGYAKGQIDFWDIIQGVGGIRETYDFAFRFWYGDYIRPKYKVVPKRGTGSISQNLRFVFECSKAKKLESKYFDFSQITFNNNSSDTKSIYGFFRSCEYLEEIEDLGIGTGGYYFTYNGCKNLHTIAVMRCVKDGKYEGTFTNCTSLKNIRIEGEIGNNISFQYSSLLTAESAISIIEALCDFSGTTDEYTRTLALHSKVISTLEGLGNTSPNGNNWIEYIDDKKWNLTVA